MTPLNIVRWCNLALTFCLELAALTALSYSGAQLGNGTVAVTLAITAPLVTGVCWGLFAAPRSVKQMPAAKVGVKITVFALATLGLYANDHQTLGVTFAGVVVANALLVRLIGKPDPTFGRWVAILRVTHGPA